MEDLIILIVSVIAIILLTIPEKGEKRKNGLSTKNK